MLPNHTIITRYWSVSCQSYRLPFHLPPIGPSRLREGRCEPLASPRRRFACSDVPCSRAQAQASEAATRSDPSAPSANRLAHLDLVRQALPPSLSAPASPRFRQATAARRCARVLVDGRDQLRCSALGPVSFGSVPIRAANGRAFMANVGADKARRQASQHQSVMRVGVHPTAAACHYYMRRDGVLRRMLVRAGHFKV